MSSTTAYIVETIPQDLTLQRFAGTRDTAETLLTLTQNATQTIDIITMYWSLRPYSDGPDHNDFTSEALEAFGSHNGRLLHQALATAAERGVQLRILQSPQFHGKLSEAETLAQQYPNHIHIRNVNLSSWYGSGIMHQTLWLFDKQSTYIGSANADWRSFAQVKELGIAIENHPIIAADLLHLFNRWWAFAQQAPVTQTIFDPTIQGDRQLPYWSPLIPQTHRGPDPLPSTPNTYTHLNPLTTHFADPHEQGTLFIASSPIDLCNPHRTDDETAVLHTIQTAQQFIYINVMDFLPASSYRGIHNEESRVWWPAITKALFQVMLAQHVTVCLLVSHWLYTSPIILPALQALQQTAQAYDAPLTIKQFTLPDWEHVEGAERLYPGHTRVNHVKFLVTDQRFHISKSNITWDYFHTCGGISLNASHAPLRHMLQKIFLRDWHSGYATELI